MSTKTTKTNNATATTKVVIDNPDIRVVEKKSVSTKQIIQHPDVAVMMGKTSFNVTQTIQHSTLKFQKPILRENALLKPLLQITTQFNNQMEEYNRLIETIGLTGELQDRVNLSIESTITACEKLEKECVGMVPDNHLSEAKAYFRAQTFKWFQKSKCFKISYEKPHGYPGDFEIVDTIYQNKPSGKDMAYAIDNYYLANFGSVAMRSRKTKVEQIVNQLVNEMGQRVDNIKILDIGCGPGTDIKEFLANSNMKQKLNIELIDQDMDALQHCKRGLSGHDFIKYTKQISLNLLFRAEGN